MEFKIEHNNFTLTFNLTFKGKGSHISLKGLFDDLSLANKMLMSKYTDDIWETIKTYDFYDINRGILEELLVVLLEHQINFDRLEQDKFLYFLVADNGLIKVGISNNVIRRVRQLERELNTNIKVLKFLEGKSAYEKIIHELYSSDNVIYKGQTEWFHPTHRLIKFVSDIDEKNIDELCQEK